MRKNILITIVLVLTLFFLSCDSVDTQSWAQIEKTFPQSKVWPIPNNPYHYIVVDTCGAVYYIETLNPHDNQISSKITIAPCK